MAEVVPLIFYLMSSKKVSVKRFSQISQNGNFMIEKPDLMWYDS